MHPFEEEFFENYTADLQNVKQASKPVLPAVAQLTLSDIDFSDIATSDFRSGLKKLDMKVTSQLNTNAKLNRSRGNLLARKAADLDGIDDVSSATGGSQSHTISIPDDREVIVEGKNKNSNAGENQKDELAEVKSSDFKNKLADFIQKQPISTPLSPGSHQIEIPADREVIVQGISDQILNGTAQKEQQEDPLAEIKPEDLKLLQQPSTSAGPVDFKTGLQQFTEGKLPPSKEEVEALLPDNIVRQRVTVPDDREIIIQGKNQWAQPNQGKATIKIPQVGLGTDNQGFGDDLGIGMGSHKIIVPDDREVIVEGVSKFILSNQPEDNEIKAIQYYKGKKLNHMTLIFNNDSELDFNIELFNPGVPVQYLIATRLNIDNKITIAGGTTTYSEMLFNILANPTMMISAQIVVSTPSGTTADANLQLNQPFFFKNKNIAGLQAIEPVNIQLTRDTMQYQPDIVYFNIPKQINRPFVVDGMDTITYKILAGNTVTISFYYKQVSFKKMVFEECREAGNLL